MMSDFGYEQLLSRIKALLEEGLKDGELYSYKRLAGRLCVSEEEIKYVVGRRFRELTKESQKGLFSEADPDLFLLGDNIEEINNNRWYQMYKNFKSGAGGVMGWFGRLLK